MSMSGRMFLNICRSSTKVGPVGGTGLQERAQNAQGTTDETKSQRYDGSQIESHRWAG